MSRPSRPTATAYGPGGEDGMEPCGSLARAWPAALFLSFVNKAARGPPLQWTSAQSLPFFGPFLIGKGGQKMRFPCRADGTCTEPGLHDGWESAFDTVIFFFVFDNYCLIMV